MIPRFTFYDDLLADFLADHFHVPLDLSARRVVDIAAVVAAASEEFAATAHLLDLLAVLPPRGDVGRFWAELGKVSDSPHLTAATMGPGIVRALDGDPAPLADQILSATAGMSAARRAAAAEVIGVALSETADFAGYGDHYIGSLWLADLERTAWRVLLATRARPESARQDRADFRAAWKDA